MSLKIPQEHLDDPSKLTEYEKLYLYDRGKLPEGVEPPKRPEPGEAPPIPSKVTPLEEQTVPTFGNKGGIVEDDDDDDSSADGGPEDYDEGWTNDERRAALAERGLNIHGKKDDLIARLLRSDAGELEEGDEGDDDTEDGR